MRHPIRLYNSMMREVEAFVPQDYPKVSMYVCGPTVYDTPHLGNARPAVVFDLLYRVLSDFYKVEYARNYTDVDDKIIARARENDERIEHLTDRTIAEYEVITAALACVEPQHKPRATAYVEQMVKMILALVGLGHAYASEGHILFSIASYREHGALSRHLQDDLRDGARVDIASYKRDPADFVLWKPSLPGEVGWQSDLGFGRPGWHIECSAMIHHILGETIDIHAGGGDLRFPHHECEISQSQCANGAPLARYWLHNGMVLVNSAKMSKSAGNFITVRDLLDKGISGAAIRLALLQTHYRSPLDWTDATIKQAQNTIDRWFAMLLPHRQNLMLSERGIDPSQALEGSRMKIYDLKEPLRDDLNTAAFFTAVHERMNTGRWHDAFIAASALREIGFFEEMFAWDELSADEQITFDARTVARQNRDYGESDRLREELKAKGINLKDMKDRTLWWRDRTLLTS